MTNKGLNDLAACKQVAGDEYERECGACNPGACAGPNTIQDDDTVSFDCPPCSAEICASSLNRCPTTTAPVSAYYCILFSSIYIF